jgi:hypothetical protein
MTLLRYMGGTYPAAGTSLTTANVGSPAPSQVTKTSASTIKAQNTNVPLTGQLYTEMILVSAESAIVRCSFNAANLSAAVSFFYYNGGTLSASETIFTVRNGSGVAFKVTINTANKVQLQTAAGASLAGWAGAVTTSPDTIPSGWVRFELIATVGTSTTGVLKCNFYSLNSTTPTNAAQFSVTTADLGSTALAAVDVGRAATPATTPTLDFWAVGLNDGGTTEIGPYTPSTNAAPTASITSAQQDVISGSTLSFTATDADSDGTVASRLWSWVSTPGTAPTITGSTTQSASAVATNPGQYIIQYVVTDNLGATSTPATQTNYVYPASGIYANPQSVTVGSWVSQGGAATPLAAITDALFSTWLEAAPGTPLLITLPPMGAGALNIGFEGTVFAGTANRTLTLYKADGTTQVDTITYALPVTDGTAATTYASATAYTVGNAVTYNGANYIVNTAVTSANTVAPDTNSSFTAAEKIWAVNDSGNIISTAALREALILKAQDA